jgi:hemolysin III
MHLPNDLGPIYAETRMDRFPVEPFNTASNLAFLLVILLLARRLRRAGWRGHEVTLLALAIIAVGFVGGTLYHATRACDLWRLLDVMPIVLVVLLASVYFLHAVLGGLLRVLLVLLPVLWGYRWWVAASAYEADPPIAFGYIFLALLVIVPAALHCGLRGWRHGRLLLLAAASFALAFVCREADAAAVSRLLPMGSHFVWHLGGASASFFALSYLMASESEMAGRAMESESVRHLPSCLDSSIVMSNRHRGRQAPRDPCQGNGTAQ